MVDTILKYKKSVHSNISSTMLMQQNLEQFNKSIKVTQI